MEELLRAPAAMIYELVAATAATAAAALGLRACVRHSCRLWGSWFLMNLPPRVFFFLLAPLFLFDLSVPATSTSRERESHQGAALERKRVINPPHPSSFLLCADGRQITRRELRVRSMRMGRRGSSHPERLPQAGRAAATTTTTRTLFDCYAGFFFLSSLSFRLLPSIKPLDKRFGEKGGGRAKKKTTQHTPI